MPSCGIIAHRSSDATVRNTDYEVGGDVADYFDPYSIEAIAASLLRLAALPAELRRERIAAGIARARTFGWDRYGERVVAACQRCLTARR